MSSLDQKFEDLQSEGKRLAAEGKLYESLQKFEDARAIKETSKVLHRIQKLKDAIAQHERLKPRTSKAGNSINPSLKKSDLVTKLPCKTKENMKNSSGTSRILSPIHNIEVSENAHPQKIHIPVNPLELSPERLRQFNELKKSAMELSYDGNFEDALETFTDALKLCNCPKVKKYIHEMEVMISQHKGKLQKFQSLSNTGKKLASEGRQIESLEKLKNAFAVCPSPKVSKMIKMLEVKSASCKKYPLASIKISNDDFVSAPKFRTSSSNSDGSVKSDSSTKYPIVPSNMSNEDSVLASKTGTSSSNSDGSNSRSPDVNRDKTKGPELAALSPDKLAQFKTLYAKARVHAAAGNLKDALDVLNKAKSICATNKILKRIQDIQEHIKNSAEESEDDKMIAVADGFYVFHEIFEKLYPYQRLGVAWMWELFKKRKGGVLGDDMGLGKTFQVIAFLSGLIDADHANHIVIIMPVSLLPNWEREFKKWCPGISVSVFHGGSKKERERNIIRVQRRGQVLLTSYGMVLNGLENLTQCEGNQFIWDYVILDEGHKIKNPTKTAKAVHNIPSRNRLVLTGTPVQNNLRELWALYDFAHQGTLLGSMKTFKMQYENIITRAREKDATVGEKHLGTEMAENLKMLIKPYFLRRTKAEIWGVPNQQSDVNDLEQGMEQLRISNNKVTTRKNDLIVWTYMSDVQCEIYQSFLHSDAVKSILVSKRSPLVELTMLKKICDHPRLLSQRACLQLGLNGELKEEDLKELDEQTSTSSTIEDVSDDTLIAESGKMRFLISLLENLKQEGHRTLVFSLSRKILDMVHRILINRGWKVMRVDGTITKIEERERRIQQFQADSSFTVFLLTTQVGGVGITLTAADRVVIYDPSWNPATDAQAVDRAYRIGQQKDVVVYRLITCGTVEEKIYRRQIFKDSITKQATSSSDPYRYFSKQELRELFTLDNPHHSATQAQLSELHSGERQSDVSLDEHIAFLHSLNIFGISDHDLMFTKHIVDHTEDNDEAAISHDSIKKQVAVAHELIRNEASVIEEGMRLAGSFARPYLEKIPSFKKNTEKDFYKPPSEIQSFNSPAMSHLSTINDFFPVKVEGKQFRMNEKSPPSVTEVIDLIDSPKESKFPTNGVDLNKALSATRKSGKKYEPLPLEKNCVPPSSEFEANTSVSDENNKSIPSTVTPSKKQHNDSVNSVFETPTATSPKKEQNCYSLLTKESPIFTLTTKLSVKEDKFLFNHNTKVTCDQSTADHMSEVSAKEDKSFEDNVEVTGDSPSAIHIPEVPVKDNFFKERVEVTGDNPAVTCSPEVSIRHDSEFLYEKKVTETDDADRSVSGSCNDASLLVLEPEELVEVTGDIPTATFSSEASLKQDCEFLAEEKVIETDNANGSLSRSPSDASVRELGQKERVEVTSNIPTAAFCSETSLKQDCEFLAEEKLTETDDANGSLSRSSCDASLPELESEERTEVAGDIPTVTCSSEASLKQDCEFLADEQLTETDDANRNLSRSSSNANFPEFESDPVPSTVKSRPLLTSSPTFAGYSPKENRSFIDNKISSPIIKMDAYYALDPELFGDLSFDDQPLTIRNTRKSCVIKQEFIRASDSSPRTSCASSANSSQEEVVIENDSEYSDSDASGVENSSDTNASLSFVASSIPNSPCITQRNTLQVQSIPMSPLRRITPLRLHKSYSSLQDGAFAKAMATSPIFMSPPYREDVADNTLIESSSDIDSPVYVNKTRKNRIMSDSDDE